MLDTIIKITVAILIIDVIIALTCCKVSGDCSRAEEDLINGIR